MCPLQPLLFGEPYTSDLVQARTRGGSRGDPPTDPIFINHPIAAKTPANPYP